MNDMVKRFDSAQTGAPTLSGTAGNMIALLDAALVNGFNLKSITSLTRSGTTVTATVTGGHGYRAYDVVLIAGANEADYNGEFSISNVTATTFDYEITGAPATPATGTITAKIAPLGWEKAYVGTNKAAYRPTDVQSNRFYLRVDDANAKYANVLGYEAMTDIDTGTGPFADTIATWNKSRTADAATRPWLLVGDGRGFYLFTAWQDGAPNDYEGVFFGDVISHKVGDAFHCGLAACNQTAPSAVGNGSFFSNKTVSSGKRLARSFTQLGTMVGWVNYALGGGGSLPTYPSPLDNGIVITPTYLQEDGNYELRGSMPGLYHPIHAIGSMPAHGAIVDNVAAAPGKRFLICSAKTSGSDVRVVVDLTGPWR